MRLDKCWFCSKSIYPGHGKTFIRNDCKSFRFCSSKCHKNFKLKRNPRKVRWTKAYRRIHKKELPDDPVAQFAKQKSAPQKYERPLVEKALKAIERVTAIKTKKEERYRIERTMEAKLKEKAAKLKFIDRHLNLIVAPSVLKNADDRKKKALEFVRAKRAQMAKKRNVARSVGNKVEIKNEGSFEVKKEEIKIENN